jgi:RND family efflux transporter MFP subunit
MLEKDLKRPNYNTAEHRPFFHLFRWSSVKKRSKKCVPNQIARTFHRPLMAFLAVASPAFAQVSIKPALQFDCVMDPAALIHVSASAAGILDTVLVKRGDKVVKGQVVARVRSAVENATITILEARAGSSAAVDAQLTRVAFSKRRVERARQLVQEKAQSISQLEEYEYDYKAAQSLLDQALLEKKYAAAELARARIYLEQTNVLSPVDGYVVETTLKPGEYATGERHIMEIVQLDPLLIEAFLPVELYKATSVGQAVTVQPAPPIFGLYTTKISVIDRIFDPASRTFGVRAELTNPDGTLPAGHRCLLDLSLQANTPAVPLP